MDAVTYPHAQVIEELKSDFVCFKLNMLDRHPDFKEASGTGKVTWAPTFIFADAKRRELRRYVGWLPPASFRAELAFVRGQHALNHGNFDAATASFDAVAEQFPGSEVAPEALYWHGIAAFLRGQRDMKALAASWKRLVAEYPGHRWATHASVIEDAK
ncbi:MAG: hypothetical protein AB7O52_08395 [Planctomycetota bacterium]